MLRRMKEPSLRTGISTETNGVFCISLGCDHSSRVGSALPIVHAACSWETFPESELLLLSGLHPDKPAPSGPPGRFLPDRPPATLRRIPLSPPARRRPRL